MAKVTWSLQALSDVSEIGLFFERDSSKFAEVVYRLVYELNRNNVSVLAVLHGSQDLLRKLGRE